jgi:hypothetical protein
LRTGGIVKAGENLVVPSVVLGADKPVLVIDANGIVKQATATIQATKVGELVISDIKY